MLLIGVEEKSVHSIVFLEFILSIPEGLVHYDHCCSIASNPLHPHGGDNCLPPNDVWAFVGDVNVHLAREDDDGHLHCWFDDDHWKHCWFDDDHWK